MRLTTKFSAFITLLTSLTIFVTLIGASLSFYNGIENKVENRVQAVATMLDNRLITTSFDKLEPQLDDADRDRAYRFHAQRQTALQPFPTR
jgi:RNase E specificity factor CsrD